MTATSGKPATAGERGRRSGGWQARHNGMPNPDDSSYVIPAAYQQYVPGQPKHLCDYVYICAAEASADG